MSRLITDDALAVITIYQEARGEDDATMLAVAEVIRNRATEKYMSDGTIAGTVLTPYQFSGWNTKDPNRVLSVKVDDATDSIIKRCQTAWLTVMGRYIPMQKDPTILVGNFTNTVDNAVVYFKRAQSDPVFVSHVEQRMVFVCKLGGMEFYKEKERGQ